MKMEDVTDYIAGQVRYHEEQLAKFRAALDVILEVAQTAGVTKPEPPMFTVKRTKPLSMDKPKAPVKYANRSQVRADIMKLAAERPDIHTFQIISMLFGDKPKLQERKAVWNALTALTKKGEIVRISPGKYAKPVTAKELEHA